MDMDLSNKGILFTLVLAENNERDVASGDWPGTMSAGLDLQVLNLVRIPYSYHPLRPRLH